MITRRATLAVSAGLLARPALGQQGRLTLTLLVGAPAGSAADRWGRGFAPFLERHWPRSSVAIANIAGGAGLVAIRAIADAHPDGKAIAAISTPFLLAQAIETGARGLIERLDFMGAVAEELIVLVTAPGVTPDLASISSIGARGRLGSPPPGSAAQLAARSISALMPLELIAFPSASTARQAVIAGNLTAALLPLPDALGAIREGRLQAVAVSGRARSPHLPDLPCFGEFGMPDVAVTQRGFVLPKGVTALMREGFSEALEAVLADPEFTAQNSAMGRTPRLIKASAWSAEVHALTDALQRRWDAEPWVRRS
jgi:tripartite-type tricarboxylate transporter receptor subunit TctC